MFISRLCLTVEHKNKYIHIKVYVMLYTYIWRWMFFMWRFYIYITVIKNNWRSELCQRRVPLFLVLSSISETYFCNRLCFFFFFFFFFLQDLIYNGEDERDERLGSDLRHLRDRAETHSLLLPSQRHCFLSTLHRLLPLLPPHLPLPRVLPLLQLLPRRG